MAIVFYYLYILSQRPYHIHTHTHTLPIGINFNNTHDIYYCDCFAFLSFNSTFFFQFNFVQDIK